MSKIQVLQTEWLSKDFSTKVLPILLDKEVPMAEERTLFLTDVFSDEYLASISKWKPDIAVLDHRHWYYPDEVFASYIQRVASFHLPAVCLGVSPYGFECPNYDLHAFEDKLYKRMKRAADTFRNVSPQTTIISPAISIVDPKLQESYLDFFVHNRSCFDVYAVHCVYDLKEQLTGLLTAFLHQVVKTLRKPVWVTRWSVPACDHKVSNSMSMISLDWEPLDHDQAAHQVKVCYRDIEEVAGKGTRWFFTGLDRDLYRPDAEIPNLWSGYAFSECLPGVASWGSQHFLGAMNFNGELKTKILDAVCGLMSDDKTG